MGFIHRDINPKNILIYVRSDRKEVTMKLADFGLSKPVNERGTCSMSGVRGTLNWYAPEILDILEEDIGNSTTPLRGTIKSDVFAEGLVFDYYLLGGQHPYGPKQIMQNIQRNNPVNLNEITKRQPIHDIIKEMLKTNPHERISSFGVVIKITTTRRLKRIEETTADGLKYSTQVRDSFFRLGQLIRQVILAVQASRGARTEEIGKLIRKANEEEKNRKIEYTKREQDLLHKEIEGAQKAVQRTTHFRVNDFFTLGTTFAILRNATSTSNKNQAEI